MTEPTAPTGAPASPAGRAPTAAAIYEALMDLSERALAAENADRSQRYSAVWDALQQSIDASAALAAALRDLEQAAEAE